ncbi:rRNA maturation RNase YbeY [Bacillaceae bacterium SIJ1]|uniref:rRNA maturation RNase YbeY n=1 Tax=Litoribacterium kuwaitense TaxID=1398745 RepID=UPI0013ECE5E7|nr:rRNA maturation RNase YbeY [Litoribacterium kuwaitense]NGP43522.1 rRNA maturation RNase YbeY [Litoribacterium kuwaitense]
MNIDVIDETGALGEQELLAFEELLTYCAKQMNVPSESEMSLSFVDDEAIQSLNATYRQKNVPTDVLSFAMQETLPEDTYEAQIDEPMLLGDVVVSLDTAKRQAEEYGHSLERELSFLTVHGLLHLLGYDHMNEADEREMFKLQEALLSGYGIERTGES